MTRSTYSTARLVYPHQLFEDHFHAAKDTLLLLVEDDLFFRQFSFHKQKLALHRASMTTFEKELNDRGFNTEYIASSPSKKSMDTLYSTLKKYSVQKVTYYELVDDWLEKRLDYILKRLDVKIERINSPGFLTTRGQIDEYFDSHPNRMQQFYEWQRKRLNILVDNDKPTGGKWSYDAANRKKLPKNIEMPPPYPVTTNDTITGAMNWTEQNFKNNPGSLDKFRYPTTHSDAKKWLDSFIDHRLDQFGPYEDAISTTENEVFHSVLSPLINIGLLTPKQVIDAALKKQKDVPIESLEGFIRQIIGWREYMRATYLRFGSQMRTTNHLNFKKRLPKSWWNASVGIEPIDTVINNVLDTGYAHHIERLMILGNSMVLLRIHPDDVYEWFMSLFIDAYDWVMVPNVYAMSQFATGELITTKPYISGSNYIIKMSDYKKDEWSEIWDALYWQFIADHKEMMAKNYRSSMVVKLYDRFDKEKKDSFKKISSEWLQ